MTILTKVSFETAFTMKSPEQRAWANVYDPKTSRFKGSPPKASQRPGTVKSPGEIQKKDVSQIIDAHHRDANDKVVIANKNESARKDEPTHKDGQDREDEQVHPDNIRGYLSEAQYSVLKALEEALGKITEVEDVSQDTLINSASKDEDEPQFKAGEDVKNAHKAQQNTYQASPSKEVPSRRDGDKPGPAQAIDQDKSGPPFALDASDKEALDEAGEARLEDWVYATKVETGKKRIEEWIDNTLAETVFDPLPAEPEELEKREPETPASKTGSYALKRPFTINTKQAMQCTYMPPYLTDFLEAAANLSRI
ncbi:hypothetical protein F4818DRAFT_319959 [Hypoxylon cercidicola]|nr:hypothetical protein F4818DRAFT_319959 [Hypoxylon cercidicola]